MNNLHKMNPLVSIVIPTYSRPTHLKRAIQSVLGQTYSNIEIIVVDDNGINTENQKLTVKILSEFDNYENIIYHAHESNQNGSAARNTGVQCSRGEYIGFLDDDDEFHSEKIAIQMTTLQNSNENNISGVYCNIYLIGKHRKYSIINQDNGNFVEKLLTGNIRVNSSTLLIKKKVFNELNGFDESFKRHQDWEFLIRLYRKHKLLLAKSEMPLVTKYQTENIISRNPIKAIEYTEFFLKTFSNDISSLNKRNLIYHHHYTLLSILLFRSKYYNEGFDYLKKASLFSKFTPQELIKIFMSFFIKSL
jgi:glycosyltransferase involved in cell wall biosynthesis